MPQHISSICMTTDSGKYWITLPVGTGHCLLPLLHIALIYVFSNNNNKKRCTIRHIHIQIGGHRTTIQNSDEFIYFSTSLLSICPIQRVIWLNRMIINWVRHVVSFQINNIIITTNYSVTTRRHVRILIMAFLFIFCFFWCFSRRGRQTDSLCAIHPFDSYAYRNVLPYWGYCLWASYEWTEKSFQLAVAYGYVVCTNSIFFFRFGLGKSATILLLSSIYSFVCTK